MVGKIGRDRIWVEWKVLRQLQRLYLGGMSIMKDVCFVIAVNTRKIGEAAGQRGDMPVLDKVMVFFNTYLRQTINSRDAKAMFNVLREYRG